MWCLISLIFLFLFVSCFSFDVIPISNFGQKNLKFSKGEYYVFSYKNEGGLNSEVEIFLYQYGSSSHTIEIYIYLDKSSITQEKDEFINYYKSLSKYNSFYNLITDEKLLGTFYIVISDETYQSGEIFSIFKIHESGAPPFNVSNNIISDNFRLSSINNLTYIFQMPVKNQKYIQYYIESFDYSGSLMIIYDENNNIIFQNPNKKSFEGYIKLDDKNSYLKIYLKVGKYKYKNYFFSFFVTISDYYNIIPLDLNTEYFQLFPSFTDIKLLLDISSLDKSYRMKVELLKNLDFIISAYDSDDPKIIQTTKGTPLDQMDFEYLYSKGEPNYFYILKNESNFKRVVISASSYNSIKNLLIRYGEKEFYYGNNVLASCMFGIGLSIPNILFQLFRKSSKQNIAPWYSLAMNILLHFAYGNLFAKPFHIGGKNSLIIGIVFFVLYIIILVCLSCVSCANDRNNKLIFNQLYHSSHEFEELRILEDLINENRKIPPKILIKAKAQHEESREVLKEFEPYQQPVYVNDIHVWNDGHISNFRHFDHIEINYDHIRNHYSEWKRVDQGGGKLDNTIKHDDTYNKFVKDKEYQTVETWNETMEYEYSSWQDNSKIFKLTPGKPIIKANFDYKLTFNLSGMEGKRRTIDELCMKGKKKDSTVYYHEDYTCNNMTTGVRCYINREEYIRIKKANEKKYLYIGIVLFILGYSSIMDCFFYFEEGENSFIIEKLISDENDCSANYMEEDKNLQLFKYEDLKKDERTERNWKVHERSFGNKYTDSLLYN